MCRKKLRPASRSEHQVVGAAGDAGNGIIGVRLARDGLGCGERGQMATGRKANHDNPVGVDLVVAGPRADQLHGAAGVQERPGQQVSVRGEPVAEDEGAKSARGKPVGHFAAFQIGGQADVRAAPQHDDR